MRAGSGWALALVSAACFGTSGVFASALLADGWSAGAAVTMRVAVAALVLTPVALRGVRGRWGLLARGAGPVLVFGLLAVAGCQLAYFLALQRLSVGVALLLEYSGVVLVVAWTWARTRRPPARMTLIGVVVCVVGLVLVLDVVAGARIDLVGVAWGLLSGVGLAAYFLVAARTDDGLPPLVTAWAGMGVGALVLGAAAAAGLLPWHTSGADVTLAGQRASWLVPVLGLSLVAAALAYVAGVSGVRRLGSRVASFVGLTEVLFAVVFAWLALGQRPGPAQAVGAVVVLAGIVLVRVGERTPAEVVAGAPPG